jgi:hypothetical protein
MKRRAKVVRREGQGQKGRMTMRKRRRKRSLKWTGNRKARTRSG